MCTVPLERQKYLQKVKEIKMQTFSSPLQKAYLPLTKSAFTVCRSSMWTTDEVQFVPNAPIATLHDPAIFKISSNIVVNCIDKVTYSKIRLPWAIISFFDGWKGFYWPLKQLDSTGVHLTNTADEVFQERRQREDSLGTTKGAISTVISKLM